METDLPRRDGNGKVHGRLLRQLSSGVGSEYGNYGRNLSKENMFGSNRRKTNLFATMIMEEIERVMRGSPLFLQQLELWRGHPRMQPRSYQRIPIGTGSPWPG
jgi:hypothetical protein